MADFRKLYTFLFNRITDALQALDENDAESAAEILKDAQIKARRDKNTYGLETKISALTS
ncbi:MAG: hypothetical protein IJ017_08535 [Oscillospiraceae bacterium]|nr:hypothetical protein [Oscillospiraceae bacterium]